MFSLVCDIPFEKILSKKSFGKIFGHRNENTVKIGPYLDTPVNVICLEFGLREKDAVQYYIV